MSYIDARVPDDLRQEVFRIMQENVGPSKGKVVMSIADGLRAEGRAEGGAAAARAAVVAVFETRGLNITDDVGERLTGCEDLEVLDRWLRRAISAASAEEVFTA